MTENNSLSTARPEALSQFLAVTLKLETILNDHGILNFVGKRTCPASLSAFRRDLAALDSADPKSPEYLQSKGRVLSYLGGLAQDRVESLQREGTNDFETEKAHPFSAYQEVYNTLNAREKFLK